MAKKATVSLLILSIILFCGCTSPIIQKLFSEDERTYDFGKTRWGYTPEHVELAMSRETGNKPVMRRPDLLIYSSKLEGVPVLRVFTFKKKEVKNSRVYHIKTN